MLLLCSAVIKILLPFPAIIFPVWIVDSLLESGFKNFSDIRKAAAHLMEEKEYGLELLQRVSAQSLSMKYGMVLFV